jgi:threonine dehydrogenase-like Zn-dependent dehydrogenase
VLELRYEVPCYLGPGRNSIAERPKPAIVAPTSAIVRARQLDATRMITHDFSFAQMLEAHGTFGQAAKTLALKVLIAARRARSTANA